MRFISLLGLCVVAAASTMAVSAADDVTAPAPGLVTLYQRDPLAASVSFATGAYGGVFQDYQVKNHQSDLDHDDKRARRAA